MMTAKNAVDSRPKGDNIRGSMSFPERRRVWVVDDNPLDAQRARRALERDYDVEVLDDGSAVLERLAADDAPDVLVLDWIMPGVSGIDVCRFLRESNPRSIQLLLLTIKHATEQVVEGLAAGADDFLSKPFHDAELRARVGALARTRSLIDRVRQAEDQLTQVIAGSPDTTLAFDDDLVLSYVSPGAHALFPEAEPGRALQQAVPEMDLDALRIAMRGAPLRLADVHARGRAYAPRLGKAPGGQALLVLTDVTEYRHEETRRSDLYITLTHDLRSPLNAILLRTEIALAGGRGLVSAELLSDLRRVQRLVQDQVSMINDFLELARLDEPALKVARTSVDLCDVLRQTIEDLEPLAASRQIGLSVITPCEALGFGDRRRLLQVTSNLVGNAIKFTPPGGSVVAEAALDAREVKVFVTDTGSGVDPEIASTIFYRFHKTQSENDGSGASSGLGLMIVRQIVELHGGQVGFESDPGHGSRFWFTIPRPLR
jgi:signal transduction histidine kinase